MRSQPSTSVSAVPPGSFQYPDITAGDRNHSSPISPSSTESPVSVRISASTPGRGRPIEWSASSSSASRAVPRPIPPLSVEL